MPADPGPGPPGHRAVRPRRSQRRPLRRRLPPTPRHLRLATQRLRVARAATLRPGDPRRCRQGPGLPRSGRRGSPRQPAHRAPLRGSLQRLRRTRRHRLRRPHPPRRRPMVVARPSPAADSAGPADRPDPGEAAAGRPRQSRPPSRRLGPRSGPFRLDRLHRARGRPRVGPSPGRWGRPGTRSTGSTPPGARRPAVLAAIRRSIGGDGPGSSNVHRGRRRTRRTDRPGHRPCWAALAQSSAR